MTGTGIISLSHAPLVPGLVFRHFRGADDFPLMVATAEASETFDGEEFIQTVETVAHSYASDYSCDPFQDLIMVEIEGRLVGYYKCWWYSEADDKTRVYTSWGCLLPEWRRKGIGQAVLPWLEARLRVIAEGHPASCAKLFSATCTDRQIGKTVLFEQFGYKPVRIGQEMVRPNLDDIPDFPLPEGLELRPVTPDHYRRIWEAATEAFRDHWGAGEWDDRDYQIWLNDPFEFQPALWQVAWDKESNEVAGQVRTFILAAENEKYGRKRGYTEAISVRRPWRRRGLARAMISRSLQAQKAAGMTESALGADSENISGATRIYEEFGFRVTRTATTVRKPM